MEIFDYVRIGLNIKKYRKEKKLTQQQLADLIGKTESSIRKYEKGLIEIPNSVLVQISDALNISINNLIKIYDGKEKSFFDIDSNIPYTLDDVIEINFQKYDLQKTVNEIDYTKMINGLKNYDENMRVSISYHWNVYLSKIFSSWYYENNQVPVKDIDLIYLEYEIYQYFSYAYDKINSLHMKQYEENVVFEKLTTPSQFEETLKIRNTLINTITGLADKYIQGIINKSNNNDLIFKKEIENSSKTIDEDYYNKHFKF